MGRGNPIVTMSRYARHMSKPWKPGKKTVELQPEARPSRIRREPLPRPGKAADPDKQVRWRSDEWEIKLAIIGIIAFALAINVITLAISAYTE